MSDELAKTALTFRVDGRTYTFRPGEVSAALVGEVRKAIGMGPRAVVSLLDEEVDLDVIAALAFMARRQAGEKVIYAVVADSITYESDIEFDVPSEAEDPDSPEA